MNMYNRWPDMQVDFGNILNRRAEELYDIPDAPIDEDGLITCAVLPLSGIVLFPSMVTPLFVEHSATLLAIEEAIRDGKTLIGLAQLDPAIEEPAADQFYSVGTEIAVGRLIHIPDGTNSVLTLGRRRLQIEEIKFEDGHLVARARPVQEVSGTSRESVALMRAVLTIFEKCVELNRSLPEEAYVYALNIEDPGGLGDLIASTLTLTSSERQEILEIFDPIARLQQISVLLGRELDMLELENQIHSRVQMEVDRSQRELYLREQLKAIQTELGEVDIWAQEISEVREQLDTLSMPEEVRKRVDKEIARLNQMSSMAPEAAIIRTYLDWLMELPWQTMTPDNLDIAHAQQVLNRDHYALKAAKERILEYIAVRSLAKESQRQPILCFVGSPGTGKTSIGRSIAEALGRKFIRISVGGVRDEAEIRGHRRTYIGALPGRILQAIRRAETRNPLFMLDEIDKLGHDFRGDPSSALLEVLDPEQNFSFSDHYLELPFDLSAVMFITTANSLSSIPAALLDRMEVIEFPGYIEEEKIQIANQYLIPRQVKENGLEAAEFTITAAAMQLMIREYTWEAGVRNLERTIAKTCRKIARLKAEKRSYPRRITPGLIPKLLGPPSIHAPKFDEEDQIGVATGVAWTENGGEIIDIEVLLVEGKGNIQVTGQVGEIMQESAQAALSIVKARGDEMDVDAELFEKTDIHIHVPEGAIPKDGPSAGITLAAALASAVSERPLHRDIAMTGEITLRGRILPVGGVREKVMAAYRLKLKGIILPAVNEKDLVEVPRKARAAMKIYFVRTIDEVFDIILHPADA